MPSRTNWILLLAMGAPAWASSCDSVAKLTIKQGKVTLAADVAAGAFTPAQGNAAPYKNLPAFCRIAAILTPTADSEIKIEVWLPTAPAWNNTLQSVGNGAWAGSISYAAMATALAAGYATASTDTGHTGNAVDFVYGHPEKFTDFAYRSIHEMTVAAKAITTAYYGSAPQHSYFNGCSTGGRQALMEAQRYPADYDGIIAGAPAINASRLQGMQVWVNQQAHATEYSYIPPEKYKALHGEVLAVCDAADGVKDGVVENPKRCKVDPTILLCQAGDTADCLTQAQVAFAEKMYAGPTVAGASVFSGVEPGSELGWAMLAAPKPMSLAEELMQIANGGDRKWSYKQFDWTTDTAKAGKVFGASLDASDPDLRPFFNRGGKLLMYHGWADPGIPPGNTVRYFGDVTSKVGKEKAEASMRLFMVPGMGHCRGGGTDTFDAPGALSRWVEHKEAPASLAAARMQNGKPDRTRPLCPYPQQAVYSGRGSTDDAANFSCRLP